MFIAQLYYQIAVNQQIRQELVHFFMEILFCDFTEEIINKRNTFFFMAERMHEYIGSENGIVESNYSECFDFTLELLFGAIDVLNKRS